MGMRPLGALHMSTILPFPDHARTSFSEGYRSGRNSWRETPETRSTSSTRRGGTWSHCETACAVTPIKRAKVACPPDKRIARAKGVSVSSMMANSSTALPESQALLHCPSKAMLYTVEMTLGKRIRAARKRLDPPMTQGAVGAEFGVTDKAISGWERDIDRPDLAKIAKLARLLKVP